jgi:hypothetical protein
MKGAAERFTDLCDGSYEYILARAQANESLL